MRRVVLFVVLFIFWYFLTWPYDFAQGVFNGQIFLAGIVFSVLLCLTFPEIIPSSPQKVFSLNRWLWALRYIPVFFLYMLKANLDLVYRVVHPAMPIKPGIVKVKTHLQSDTARTILANSITLTPGTMTVDIMDDGYLYVHWIYVHSKDPEIYTHQILGRFEKYLKRIFE